ncbi:MAG: DUF721 domain-containing protein [Bacteroidales bacterium]|jgi:hypothetical protein|nr:DUF721 domain-containing protein [Bacteroidales bacterium]
MRKSETLPIKELVEAMMKQYGLNYRYNEVKAISLWSEILGQGVDKMTRNIVVKNGNMVVYLNSSVLRNHLFGMREAICKEINKRLGTECIRNVILK